MDVRNELLSIYSQEQIDEFDSVLDEQGDVAIGGLEYLPSMVLASVDPTAYRCMLADYADAQGWEV